MRPVASSMCTHYSDTAFPYPPPPPFIFFSLEKDQEKDRRAHPLVCRLLRPSDALISVECVTQGPRLLL